MERLNDSAGIEKMRRYIFYTETQTFLNGNHYEDNPYLLGLFNNTAYYFQYDAEGTTTLNHDF
jgi:adenine-specific DNA-methyltransferase